MEEHFLAAFDHIQVIRGICYGIVTEDDLHQIAMRYGLSETDIIELENRLHHDGVHVFTEDEKFSSMKEHGLRPPVTKDPPTPDELLSKILQRVANIDPAACSNYDKFIELLESHLAEDETTLRLYHMKREGATMEEICHALSLSEEEASTLEKEIYKSVCHYLNILRPRRVHHTRRKKFDYT